MEKLLLFILVLLLTTATILPETLVAQAPEVRVAVKSDVSIPFRKMVPVKKSILDRLFKETEKEVPNRFHVKPMINPELIIEADGALQEPNALKSVMALTPTTVNFDGLNNSHNSGGRVTPPDPSGDVGPNHYVQAVNCMLRIYNKSGASLYGPVTTATIWSGFSGNWDGHNDGDPIVMYDEQADRWIISQFAVDCPKVGGLFTEYQLVAVSTSPDPTGSYYRYAFQFDYMPDYPKLGVWQDGYYMAVNRFNTNTTGAFVGAGACVLNRTKMLAGDPTASMIYYKCETLGGTGSGLGTDCYSMLPGDCDGTPAPAGTPNYFTYLNDNSWGSNDELRIWALKPDWTTPANSTMSFVTVLPVASFSLFTTGTEIIQKGSTLKLDCLDDRLMYRQQYRNMGTYESMVTCHSVNTGSNVGGVRWYEMRKSGTTWTLYQQGTYTLSDTKSRWLGSVAMNGAGDIALGYTVSNASTYPSIYFTGRKSTDPLGTMTFTESPIVDGAFSMTGTATRWGDYAMMSVDPTDNLTFWHTNEYIYSGTGTWPWGTKIASFKLSSVTSPVVNTLAATSLTASSALLNGTVNPGGLATNYYFDYGTTTSYGTSTAAVSAGSGTTAAAASASISSLVAGSTYHFRIVATNTGGTSYGSDLTFTPGQAVVSTTIASAISTISASAGGNVSADGGSTITARGVCWGTATAPVVTGSHTSDGTGTGVFSSSITGLTDNTLYYYRAYATNGGGTVYGNELSFNTASVSAPLATAGSGVSAIGFTANWNAASGAQSYKFDVSTTSTFTSGASGTLTEGFNNGITAPSGWTFTSIGATYTSTGNYGTTSPSVRMDATGDRILTPALSGAASSLSFWIKGQTTNATCALLVEGYNGTSWVTIQNITNSLPVVATTKIYNSASVPALPANLVQFRFTYTKSVGNLAFDDVSITYGAASSFVPGYENIAVSGLSQAVTGLLTNTPYYYRVRAVGSNSTSVNSNVISVTTGSGGGTLPAAYAITGGGAYCEAGTGLAIGLAGSEAGVTYTLYKDNVAQAPTVAGTGSAISFGVQTAGTFTVKGTNGTGTTTMTGSVANTINLLPTAFSVIGGGAYCSGSAGVASGLSGSQTGITYQLYNGATAVGSAVAGTGSALNFGIQTTAGTYTVVATNTTTLCSRVMTGSAVVSVNPLPTAFTVTGGGSYCSGGTGVTIGLSGSQSGVNYQLYNGAAVVGTAIAGTGSALTFGLKTAIGTYTVIATNATTSCVLSMTGSIIVSVSPTPTAFIVNGGGAYCSGGTGVTVGLSGSQIGVSYTLYIGTTAVGAAVAGTGSAISFGLKTTAGTYTSYANKGSACELLMTSSVKITINALPTVTITGLAAVNTSQVATYTSQASKTLYTWSVSGGSITSGGTSTSRTATVTWGLTGGTGHVLVNYSNSSGCRAASAKDYPVTITKIAGLVSANSSDSLNISNIPANQSNIYSYDKKVFVNMEANGRIDVYNIAGQLVKSTKAEPGLISIPVNSSGIYVVKVSTDGDMQVKKVWIRQ